VLTNPTGNKWVLNPNASLAARTTYTVTVVAGAVGGVKDLAGNNFAGTTWTFTTA
jgi:hypothetical protein